VALTVRAVAQSDVGLVRAGNEDSGYAGPRLLVVADGMGGHAAGEIASAVTVETLAVLDGPGPAPDDGTAGDALTEAVVRANRRIRDLVEADPRRAGMGTTVTALLWTGAGFGLAHIGDSRAYLLREGELTQLTRDHTFVQALIDEGRITEAERETHPARSLLLQALGGDVPQPDTADVPALPGDRLILCSDGLSGVVAADAIRDVLTSERDAQAAADRLVELARQAGGPDNITCVVADVLEVPDAEHDPRPDDTTEAHLVGAAAIGAGHPDALRYDVEDDEPADAELVPGGLAGAPPLESPLGSLAPKGSAAEEAEEAERYALRRRSPWRWLVLALALLALLAVVGLGVRSASDWYAEQYYVGTTEEFVAIRQGVPGVPGSAVSVEVDDLPVAALPEVYQEDVSQGIRADDLADAEQIVMRLRREACLANDGGRTGSAARRLDCTEVTVRPGTGTATAPATPTPSPGVTAGAGP
jgi:protein phosphatase